MYPTQVYLEDVLRLLKSVQEMKGVDSVASKNKIIADLIVDTKGLFLKIVDVSFKKKLNVNTATIKKVLAEPVAADGQKLTLENFIAVNETIANTSGVLSSQKKELLLKKVYSRTNAVYHQFLNDYYETGVFKMGFNEKLCLSCIIKMYPSYATEIRATGCKFKRFWLYELYLNCVEGKFSSEVNLFYKPMLATAYEPKKFKPNEYYGEVKYDGFRVLVRKEGQNLTYWSRSGNAFDTPNFLKALQPFSEKLKLLNDDFTLDGEVWLQNQNAFDCFRILSPLVKTKELNARYQQKYFNRIRYTFFDVLVHNNRPLLDVTYAERRKILCNLNLGPSAVTDAVLLTDTQVATAFFENALNLKYEGILLKHKDSLYEPNKRSLWWMKKKPCMDTLDVKVLNFKKGTGKYSHLYASFTIGLENEKNETVELGNIGSGFNELDLKEINALIESKKDIILEVTADSVTKSKKYAGGWALRFPRLVGIRRDKTEPDSISKFKQIYRL